MKILCINNGYYNMKVSNTEIFQSRIMKNDMKGVKGTSDVLDFEGQSYLIGTGNFELSKDKTETNHTKLLILNACARFVDDDSEETFKLMLSCPPKVHHHQSKALPEYLLGTYKVNHNGADKVIKIVDVKVQPETIMAYVANASKQWDDKKVLIIDIGGNTSIGVNIDCGDFNLEDGVSEINNGMYYLDKKISAFLSSKELENITINDVVYGRKKGALYNKKQEELFSKHETEIDKMYIDHVGTIMNDLNLMNWNISNPEILITGGGGLELYETIAKHFLPKAKLSKDPLLDTLKGLEIMSKWAYKK